MAAVLPASSEWRPETFLSCLQCRGRPLPQRMGRPPVSVVPRSTHPGSQAPFCSRSVLHPSLLAFCLFIHHPFLIGYQLGIHFSLRFTLSHSLPFSIWLPSSVSVIVNFYYWGHKAWLPPSVLSALRFIKCGEGWGGLKMHCAHPMRDFEALSSFWCCGSSCPFSVIEPAWCL